MQVFKLFVSKLDPRVSDTTLVDMSNVLSEYYEFCDMFSKYRVLSVGLQTQWGQGGYVKERLELAPMSSFDIEQGGVNPGPDSRGVPEWVRTDGPGFSLCAVPLESSGPGFRSGNRRSDE